MSSNDDSSSGSSLKAAISPDGSLVAVVVPSTEHRVIQLFQVDSGLLQTTLTARKDNENSNGVGFSKVLFCGQDHVVALCASSVMIWDLSRGGVVAHCIRNDAPHHHHHHEKQYHDAAVANDQLFLLVAVAKEGSRRSSASGVGGDGDDDDGNDKNDANQHKLQVHQYDPQTGKLLRKIKCGKCSNPAELGLAVTKSNQDTMQLFVRNGNNNSSDAFRIIDAETGNKEGKHKWRDHRSKKQPTAARQDGSGGSGIVVSPNIEWVAVPRLSTVALYHLKTCTWVQSISTKTELPVVRMWTGDNGDGDDKTLLLVDTKVYQCSTKSVDVVSELQSEHAMAVLPRGEYGYQLVATLFQQAAAKTSLQIQLVDLVDDNDDLAHNDDAAANKVRSEISIQWRSPTTTEAVVPSSDGKKRTSEQITVLGPGQAGGESDKVSEAQPNKRSKTADDDNEEGGEDADEDMEEGDENDPSLNMTIAERLQRLTQVMDEKDKDDDDDHDDDDDGEEGDDTERAIARQRSDSFTAKKATTESLTQLLSQALRGGDDGLLELALTVRDNVILQETFKTMELDAMDILLTKLTTRLASKPQRADELAFWLSRVLQSGRIQRMSQLQPLKNLLQERIEAFPHLLRLEGRLSMVKSVRKRPN